MTGGSIVGNVGAGINISTTTTNLSGVAITDNVDNGVIFSGGVTIFNSTVNLLGCLISNNSRVLE